jgi:hypothetical protein
VYIQKYCFALLTKKGSVSSPSTSYCPQFLSFLFCALSFSKPLHSGGRLHCCLDLDCIWFSHLHSFVTFSSENLSRHSKELAFDLPLITILLLTKMHRLLALLLVAILATVALAAPTAKQASTPSLKKRSFTIPRIRKTGYIRKPSEAMGRAYRKFGWSMTTPDGSPWVAVSKTPTTMNLHADVSSPSNTSSSDLSTATNDRHLSNLKDWFYASFSWGYTPPAASSAVAAPSAEASYAAASSAAVSYITASSAAASYTVTSSAAAAASATPTPANASPAPAYAAPAPAADGDDETGEVIATPADNGAEYLSPVTIGGQKLNLNFDTGSSDLYV